jgi:hypothetical protein
MGISRGVNFEIGVQTWAKSPKVNLEFVTLTMGKSPEIKFDFEPMNPKKPQWAPKISKSPRIKI